ncbi:MAG: hypothetical protein ACJ75J_08945 [Cytophagaceae bacterium]
MKKLLWLLLLLNSFTFLSVFAEPNTPGSKFFLRKTIDLRFKENISFHMRRRMLSEILYDAVKRGDLEAYNPGNGIGKSKNSKGIELFSGETFGEESFYLDFICGINILEEVIGPKLTPRYLSLVWPADLNDHAIDFEIARFNYSDCERIFARDPRAVWINPYNNADTMDFGKALKLERYKIDYITVLNDANKILYYSFEEENTLERTSPEINKVLMNELKRLNDPSRDIFKSDIKDNYLKYRYTGVAYTEDPVNIAYTLPGRAMAKFIVEAVNAGKLQPYMEEFGHGYIPCTVGEFNKNREVSSYSEEPDTAEPVYFRYGEMGFRIIKELYIYPDGRRKETLQSIDLFIPYNFTIKGINVTVGCFNPEQFIALLKADSRAVYYHPQNLADSCNFGDAIAQGKFRFMDIYVDDCFRREFLNISTDEKGKVSIMDIHGDTLDREIFKTKSADRDKAIFYPFRDDVAMTDHYCEFPASAKTKSGLGVYNQFSVLRVIDLSKAENQVLMKKKKEITTILIRAAKEGRIKAYSTNMVNIIKPDSVKYRLSYEKYHYDSKTYKSVLDSVYDFNDVQSLKFLMVNDEYVYKAGQGKSKMTRLMILNPVTASDKDSYYLSLLEFDYADVLKLLREDKASAKNKELLNAVEKYTFNSKPVIVFDIFNRYFSLDWKDVYECYPQLSVFK